MSLLRDFYGASRSLNPATGDVDWYPPFSTWTSIPGARQRVIIALRTQLGQCLVAPTLGVDWQSVTNAALPQRALVARTAILVALAGLVKDGSITQLSVSVDVPSAASLTYSVSYYDVQLGTMADPVAGSF